MDKNQYDIIMDQLADTYGKFKYSATRRDILFVRFKDVPTEAFRRVAFKFISTSKDAPLEQHFRDALRPELEKIREAKIKKLSVSGGNCLKCGNTGVVSAHRVESKKGESNYSFN